jgi:hypothetical protein
VSDAMRTRISLLEAGDVGSRVHQHSSAFRIEEECDTGNAFGKIKTLLANGPQLIPSGSRKHCSSVRGDRFAGLVGVGNVALEPIRSAKIEIRQLLANRADGRVAPYEAWPRAALPPLVISWRRRRLAR